MLSFVVGVESTYHTRCPEPQTLSVSSHVRCVIVSSHPPLPPVTRMVAPAPVHDDDQPHTIPGWVGGVIYLVLLIVFWYLVLPRL